MLMTNLIMYPNFHFAKQIAFQSFAKKYFLWPPKIDPLNIAVLKNKKMSSHFRRLVDVIIVPFSTTAMNGNQRKNLLETFGKEINLCH